jgi:hypothetical protein
MLKEVCGEGFVKGAHVSECVHGFPEVNPVDVSGCANSLKRIITWYTQYIGARNRLVG